MGLRFQQQSAEIRALQLQAYNVATARLDAAVAAAPDPAKLAVVTDLDETVIDNSALLARDLANCHVYDAWDTWLPWERDGEPTLIPGAKEFLDHADGLGVAIFYISDRADEQKEHTLETLTALGLPQVSPETRAAARPAEGRAPRPGRGRPPDRPAARRHAARLRRPLPQDAARPQIATVAEEKAKWGTEWIAFPNASYGTWSEAPLDAWAAETVIEPW